MNPTLQKIPTSKVSMNIETNIISLLQIHPEVDNTLNSFEKLELLLLDINNYHFIKIQKVFTTAIF